MENDFRKNSLKITFANHLIEGYFLMKYFKPTKNVELIH